MKKIIVLSLLAACMMSCSHRSHLMDRIDAHEARLDSIAAHFPFMDTVGETDDYQFLVEAYDRFLASDNEKEARKAYDDYVFWYNRCISMYEEIKANEIK